MVMGCILIHGMTSWESFAIEIALLPPELLGALLGALVGLILPAAYIARVWPVIPTLGMELGANTGFLPANMSKI